ncbi:3-phosphoshikimate 1-carboxyvinyltransferase [Gammaproteobacteria bacterium]|nr:3-phosphoshikimate 1-carboxyvinyltransferase [Gammaproteobacteria bacterium]
MDAGDRSWLLRLNRRPFVAKYGIFQTDVLMAQWGQSPDRPESSRSPWSTLSGVEQVTVGSTNGPIRANLAVPGSKSFSNRLLLLAAMAEGESRLSGVLESDDCWWGIETLHRLGCEPQKEADTIVIQGCNAAPRRNDRPLYLGSAGTLGRFLPSLLMTANGGPWTIDASEQLRGRPLKPLLDVAASIGGRCDFLAEDGCLPIRTHGNSLAGGALTMSGSLSSQFVSGMLMAGPLSPRGLELTISDHIVQSDYVRITLAAMRDFGAEVEVSEAFDHFRIAPGRYRGGKLAVEADASTASYFFALAAITGGEITVNNIGSDTLQPDLRFVDVLEKLGAEIERQPHRTTVRGTGILKGNQHFDMRPLSDASLTLAAVAPYCDGPITIENVAHIRHHESDRIAVMCRALEACGIRVEEKPDGMTIYPGRPRHATQPTHDDHRVAMSLAVLGAASEGMTLIDPGCVSKTCPPFFELIGKLGIDTDC